jgi:hypothetical protein
VTAAVEHVAPDGPRVAHWHGSPPPLRVVSVPPLECVDLEPAAPRYAGRFTDRAAYERHKLRNAAAKIRQAHPRMSVDASLVEAHARRSWRELHPGTCVGNGLTLAEHLRGQRVRVERAAKRRGPNGTCAVLLAGRVGAGAGTAGPRGHRYAARVITRR